MNLKFFTFVFGVLLSIVVGAVIKKSQCLANGFNENTLQCSTCEILSKIVSNKEAYENCKVCCVEKSEDLFKIAVLEIDNRYLTHLPDLEAIISQKDELNLQVKYRFGSPVLKMYKVSVDEEPSESISVGMWNQDNFREYLKAHLQSK